MIAETAIQLVFEAMENCGRSGFIDWMNDNKSKLESKERQNLIDAYFHGKCAGASGDTTVSDNYVKDKFRI